MLKLFFSVALCWILNSCSQLPFGDEFGDITQTTAKKILETQIKDFVLDNAPVLPAATNPFSTTVNLPNGDFKPNLKNQPEIQYNDRGEMLLQAGDYVIPVMTFCLKHNADSPSGYIYTLNQLQGSSAKVIRQINLKAFPKYTTKEIQVLIWNILGGLSYSEMDSFSQKIIDEAIPEHKSDLEKSYYQKLIDKWNSVAEKSHGIVPNFEEATQEYLSHLGNTGTTISEVKDLHDKILQAKGNYESLRSSISTRKVQQKEKNPLWSKISDQVYARFVTNGSYNEVGTLQVRVIAAKRQTSAVQKDVVAVDVASLIADPNNNGVQLLALFPLYGFGGVAIESAAINPYAAAAVMAAILAAKVVDWNAFFDLVNRAGKFADQAVKDMVKNGDEMLSEVHDRLEQPAKDSKIISGKDLDKNKTDKITRQYNKTGDNKTLDEDFDKLPGERALTQDGKEMKIFPNGDKAIKRPKVKEGDIPTIEFQPGNGGKERVKVRHLHEIPK